MERLTTRNIAGMAWFDEEGTEFTLVLNPYSMFIIAENEHTELIDFSKVKIDDLIKELIQDIENDLAGWSMFDCSCDEEEEIKVNREYIRNLICQLKEYV